MSSRDDSGKSTRPFWTLLALLSLAVIVGGGGVRYGLANLVVQITALVALGFHREAFVKFWRDAPLALRLLVAATLLLPILHLVPLPTTLLSALSGRELVLEGRAIAGAHDWFPASVDPARTLVALTGLILPLTILAIGRMLSKEQLINVGWAMVGLSLLSFLLGVIQVMSDGQTGLFYPENPMPGVLFGTFANRNSAGLFFVGVLSLASLLPSPRELPATLVVRLVVCAVLLLAVLLTRSRSAIVLAALPVGLLTVRLVLSARSDAHRRGLRQPSMIASALLAIGFAAVIALSPGRISDSIERFDARSDAREEIWDDASYSAQRYWPIGAGMGTFDEVFQIDESLENLSARRAGRVHNDYLEVAIEAGLPGLVLIAGWLCMVLWLTWRTRRSGFRWAAWSGSVILIATAAQSLVDYPLRSQGMLGFAALALIILLNLGSSSGRQRL